MSGETDITQAIEKVEALIGELFTLVDNDAGTGTVAAKHYEVGAAVRGVAKVAQERMRERVLWYDSLNSQMRELIAALPLELGDDDG